MKISNKAPARFTLSFLAGRWILAYRLPDATVELAVKYEHPESDARLNVCYCGHVAEVVEEAEALEREDADCITYERAYWIVGMDVRVLEQEMLYAWEILTRVVDIAVV